MLALVPILISLLILALLIYVVRLLNLGQPATNIITIVLVVAWILWLVGGRPLWAQGPMPSLDAATPAAIATGAPAVPEPTVDIVNGIPVAKVPAPPSASPSDVRAIAEQAADNAKSVASGEVTIDQATRNPATTADPGASQFFNYLSLIGSALATWVIRKNVLKNAGLPDISTSFISGACVLGLALIAFALFHYTPIHVHLASWPQTLSTWMATGGFGALLGAMAQSGKGWLNEVAAGNAAPKKLDDPQNNGGVK